MEPIYFSIRGTGEYLPRREVGVGELATRAGLTERDITDTYGVGVRRWAAADETSSVMGAAAARAALDEAGWRAQDLDVIVGACGVMEQPIPGTSVLIQRRLGLGGSGIPCLDVNATCLSFLAAFDRVLAGFVTKQWRRALIVSADIATAALDFSDPETSVLFSDGAAAVALEAEGAHRCLAMRFETYGDGADVCQLQAGGTRLRPRDDWQDFLAHSLFQMDGRGVFRAVSRPFPLFLARLFEAAGMGAADLDLVIPHQASAVALEHLKRALPDGHAKTIDLFREVGNQIAVSLPFALHRARRAGRVRPGDRGLLIGSSAGVSLGGAAIQW